MWDLWPPTPTVALDRQVVVFTGHQASRETTVEFPLGFDQGSLYVFFGHYNSPSNMEKRRVRSEF